MRIISGKHRGKKLLTILSEDIRPTSDRTKEAVFNILFDKVQDSVFIDMFSGSGQMGIEAISRGARKVFFIDNNPQSLVCIKENTKGIDGDFEILDMNFEAAIRKLKKQGVKADIAYCDPPYDLDLGGDILKALSLSQIMNYQSVIAIERKKSFSTPKSKAFFHYDTRSYAHTAIDFYKREKRVAITGTFDPFTKGHMDLVLKAKETFDRIYIVLLINKDKKIRYSLEKRKKVIFAAIEGIEENIIVEDYEGMTIDYCAENDIQYILRGVRDTKDFEYEKQMADYNYKFGGVTTILMPAKSSISSTKVKEDLDSDKNVSHMIDKKIIEILKE